MLTQNKKNCDLYYPSSQIIVTKGVKEYRRTIPRYVLPTDVVLEIGFAWGTTTALLAKAAKRVIGIDKGESYYTAIRTYPTLELYKIDGFDIQSVMRFGLQFDVVYIDISGCRELHTVLKIIRMYENVFKPRLIVVKSSRLKRLVSQCEVVGG